MLRRLPPWAGADHSGVGPMGDLVPEVIRCPITVIIGQPSAIGLGVFNLLTILIDVCNSHFLRWGGLSEDAE